MADENDGWVTLPDTTQKAPPPKADASGWMTLPDDHPTAPTVDWSDKLNENDAKKYIDALPDEQQHHARNAWADEVVRRSWGKPGEGHLPPDAAMLGRVAQGYVGEGWVPKILGAAHWATGHSYEMSKALEEAKLRRIEQEPSTKLLETPFGDVYASGVQKGIGVIGSAANLPMARVMAGETLGPRAANAAATTGLYGAAMGAGEGETPEERAGNALIGGGIGVVAGPVLGEGIGAGIEATRLAGRRLSEAYNPQLGSDRALIRSMQEAGIAPQEIIDEIVPGISAQLGRRPYTQPQIDALVARARNPQTDYDRRILSFLRNPQTRLPLDPNNPQVAAVLNTPEFRQSQVTEMLQRALAGEPLAQLGPQYGVHPQTVANYLANFRANNPTPMNIMDYAEMARGQAAGDALAREARQSWIRARDIEAGQRIHDRNIEQPGRITGQLQGRNYEARLAAERQNLQNASDAAYRQFYQEPPLATDQLADLLEDPTFANAVGMARRQVRADIINQNQQAARAGQPQQPVPSLDREEQLFEPQILDKIQRQLRIASQGHTNPNEARHAGDLRNVFLDRIEDHYPTFRGIRENYAEGLGDQEAMEAGAALVPKIGADSRELLAGFRTWSPERQELARLGFERRMTDDVLNNPTAALRRFQSPGFQELVGEMYPHQRAQELTDYLRGEFITRRIGNQIFGNSNTAQTEFDLRKATQGAKAVGELLSGRPWSAWNDLGAWLERQIGTRQARATLRTLTEMRPAEQLENLERLAHVGRTDTERAQFREIVRGARREILQRAILGGGSGLAQAMGD